jgi:coenzyme PQQ precursor peptide PqqA
MKFLRPVNPLTGNAVLSWQVPTACCAGLNPGLVSRVYNVRCRKEPFTEDTMAWTTPTLVEICIGLEINGYLPAEF